MARVIKNPRSDAGTDRSPGRDLNPGTANRIRAEQAEWERQVAEPHIRQKPENQEEFCTGSDEFTVERIYTPADVAHVDYSLDLGFPGQYPFTRGVMPVGYRNWAWGLGYYSGHGSGEDTNHHYKQMIAHGANLVTVAMDLPTQLGYDSDHPLATGEVGKVGVAVTSLRDMETIFDGIPLDRVRTGTVGNCIGYYTVSLFAAVGEKQGLDPRQMHVSLQNDPLKEYTGRGTYIYPVHTAVELAADVVEYVCKHIPTWEPQYCCSTQMRWGGATAAQELGFGIANLMTYVEAGLRRGLDLSDFVPLMNLHMTTDNDLFEEAAKFRAARRLWARLMQERYGAQDPRVLGLRITTFTNGTRMTAQQPMNNIVRGTVHALASILGGVEGITVPAYDEALALPTLESTRLAHLTKNILHYEHGVGATVDPLAGSYYVENLTCELEEKARQYFDTVDAMGGATAAIEKGYYQREMAEGMLRYQRSVESGDRKVVGVNIYARDEEVPIELFAGNPEASRRQTERLQQLRQERSTTRVRQCLDEIRRVAEAKAAGENANLVPAVMAAVKAYATVGEICSVMREIFGEYQAQAYI